MHIIICFNCEILFFVKICSKFINIVDFKIADAGKPTTVTAMLNCSVNLPIVLFIVDISKFEVESSQSHTIPNKVNANAIVEILLETEDKPNQYLLFEFQLDLVEQDKIMLKLTAYKNYNK